MPFLNIHDVTAIYMICHMHAKSRQSLRKMKKVSETHQKARLTLEIFEKFEECNEFSNLDIMWLRF